MMHMAALSWAHTVYVVPLGLRRACPHLIYQIWHDRNAKIHRQKYLTPKVVAAMAFESISCSLSPPVRFWETRASPGNLNPFAWCLRPQGWLKANFDGSLSLDGTRGYAVVVQDLKGNFVAAKGRPMRHWDSSVIELHAFLLLKDFLSLIIERGGLVIEGVCANVLQQIQSFIGAISMLAIWLKKEVFIALALLLFTIANAGMAIADVTIDACVAQNSITQPSLAADMQSLCGLSSSIGSLIGFFISGFIIAAIGSKAALGLLGFPSVLVFSVGMVLKERGARDFSYRQIHQKLMQANQTMWATLKCDEVWKPCIFMFTSLALTLNIQEGMFYWYTDSKTGPSFSQKTISFMYSIGSVGSLLGVIIYQNSLKDYPFRCLLFWTQLLTCILGMLDFMLVLHLNLKLGISDPIFVVIGEGVSQLVGRVRWMPILVLSSRLCPMGIEGTFFALLMSIDHAGMLASTWGGGLLLQILKVTRTEFDNLWMAILIRNVLRLLPLLLLNLVPQSIQHSREVSLKNEAYMALETNDVEQEPLVLH